MKPMKHKARCGMCGSYVNLERIIDIDQNTALKMLREARDKMYTDLLNEGKLDGNIPVEHFSILNLWDARSNG